MKINDSANKHSRDVQKILFHLSRKKERARERVAELQCTDSVTRLGNFVTIWAKFQTPCANIFEKRAQNLVRFGAFFEMALLFATLATMIEILGNFLPKQPGHTGCV